MTLITRPCPICGTDDYKEVVTLRQDDFITNNPTYRLDQLNQLGLDPKQLYPIVKCCQCQMIYSLYHLNDKTEALVYQNIIDPEASLAKVLTVSRRIKDIKHWLELLSLVNESKPGKIDLKVMDYGCGWGTLLLAVRGPGVQVVGFDVTEWKVAWAREQGLTICTSAAELKAYAPFDIGICASVLEHLRLPRDTVAEITALLKPESYALMTCIIPEVAQESGWDEIRKRLSSGIPLPKEINPWEHLNYFTVETLSHLLSQYGFVPAAFETQPGNLRRVFKRLVRPQQTQTPQYWQIKRT